MREIPAAGKLSANVEGDISDVDGVLRITAIRLHYRLQVPAGVEDKVRRALETYADKCPAYVSVKDGIQCSWTWERV